MFQQDLAIEVDAEALEANLDRRLRARVERADSAVTISPELLRRWAQEEFAALVQELADLHSLAHRRDWN